MILLVFGAGASFDAIPSKPASQDHFLREYQPAQDRLPLANQLFAETELVRQTILRFPKCRAIVPQLRHLVGNISVEEVLEGLQAKAAKDHETACQLMAIRYFLNVMLLECQTRCHDRAGGVTNYGALLNHLFVNRNQEEPLCIVTFNYDTLIENALEARGLTFRSFDDYITHSYFRLFKLHGSLNWVREVDADINYLRTFDDSQ